MSKELHSLPPIISPILTIQNQQSLFNRYFHIVQMPTHTYQTWMGHPYSRQLEQASCASVSLIKAEICRITTGALRLLNFLVSSVLSGKYRRTDHFSTIAGSRDTIVKSTSRHQKDENYWYWILFVSSPFSSHSIKLK
jgi:hypothetical protein